MTCCKGCARSFPVQDAGHETSLFKPLSTLVLALSVCPAHGRLVTRRCSSCSRHPVPRLLASPAQPPVPHWRLLLRRRAQRGHTRRLTMRRNRDRRARRLCQLARGEHGVAAAAAAFSRSSRRSSTGPGQRLVGLQGPRRGGLRRCRLPRLCAPCSRCRRLRTTRHCRCALSICALTLALQAALLMMMVVISVQHPRQRNFTCFACQGCSGSDTRSYDAACFWMPSRGSLGNRQFV